MKSTNDYLPTPILDSRHPKAVKLGWETGIAPSSRFTVFTEKMQLQRGYKISLLMVGNEAMHNDRKMVAA